MLPIDGNTEPTEEMSLNDKVLILFIVVVLHVMQHQST